MNKKYKILCLPFGCTVYADDCVDGIPTKSSSFWLSIETFLTSHMRENILEDSFTDTFSSAEALIMFFKNLESHNFSKTYFRVDTNILYKPIKEHFVLIEE